MITVEEAKHIILQNTQDFGVEEIPFLDSVGRVLKEDIVADRDFPPFNRVAMDGIAINYRFFQYGVRDFKIEGVQPAGSEQEAMINASNCYEVMTGAVLPENCDTVIRYEDVSINTLMATVNIDEITEGQNIHYQGKDRNEGDILIKKNTVISPSEIGVLATVGKSKVKVAKLPKVMIVSTGDELVGVDKNPEAHQIRRSNVFTLVSLLNELKIPSEIEHLTDKKEVLQQKITSFLNDFDVLLFSGAVSKGKFDFLPEVLEELGVEKLFHRVSQRPGKPFWMGQTDTCKVFAFPGNPVSTFVNCLVYFYPWYYKSAGVKQQPQTAILTENVSFKPDLTYFLQVKLTTENGQLFATPIKGNGSGDLASLVEADGFIELPKTEEAEFKKGEVYPVIRFR
ncbi:molybdopterin molybdochelatase [Tenacibaculum adriaticum]|uniref:Molybdopterin molybdenumtransferase n=1 Tax=Tenacibaculum adriaticum TaxID=413713 RepID=A0A5S5DVQ1_9FLAO|nr:molybdopterin molybdotransferase MoeA [Tenacibaculum adriaticum]TYP99931.1 molybdopterin molybdochelatase [Tenacibaculum adriaticum]